MKPGWDTVELKGLSFVRASQAPHVLLGLAAEQRVVMIPVGMHEAQAVLEALDPDVPADTAYDVVSQLIAAEGLSPQHLEIDRSQAGDLVAGFTYGDARRLDLSAGRGLALAAKVGVPVYMRRGVARSLSVALKDADLSSSEMFFAPPSSGNDHR